MKKMFSLALLLFLATTLCAQNADKVLGVWITQEGDSKVTITQDDSGKFNGEITWLKNPKNDQGKPKVDDKNPNKKLQSRPIVGLNLLQGFVYNKSKDEWVDGTIYDPNNGKTYKCLMWFGEDPNKLSVKGYIGFSIIGREVVWTRDK
jgi:uncharacterized protein (DUF2147 family)